MLANIPYMDPMGKDFPFSRDLNFRFHVKFSRGGVKKNLGDFVLPLLQPIF